MALFNRTATTMVGRTTLLLPTDPGEALLDAARLYDPDVRRWHGRLVFNNGVLLYGPVTMTPKIEQAAGLPAGMAVAWYTSTAIQNIGERRPEEMKQADGECLVRGLAVRLGGITRPAHLQPKLALLASVYSEQGLAPEQVAAVLRPFAGDLEIEDKDENGYNLSGKDIYFYTAYTSPRLFVENMESAALGKLRSGKLHHWKLLTGVEATHAARGLCLKVGEAALALASQVGGVVIDVLGFRVSNPEDMLLR
jgi:hypothetical protein